MRPTPLTDLVRLSRSGGIIGATTEVAVSRRGRVRLRTLQGERILRLTGDELARLRCALDEAGPDRLPSQTRPPDPDGFVDVIASRTRRVRLFDPASAGDLTTDRRVPHVARGRPGRHTAHDRAPTVRAGVSYSPVSQRN
jgi:hypothetical protein